MHKSNRQQFRQLSGFILLLLSSTVVEAVERCDASVHNLASTNFDNTMPLGLHGISKNVAHPLEQPPVYLPPQVPLDVEGYPVAPEGLQLEQVHVYVRHGERTPVNVRLAEPPASIPEHWNMCKTARQFRDAIANTVGPKAEDAHPYVRKIVERTDGTLADGDCLLGELTDLGQKSTFHYGRALRRLYIERLGFIPDQFKSEKSVYFRSTNMPRTMESLNQIIHGLYPAKKCHLSRMPLMLIRNGKDENLIGNTYSCKRLEMLQIGFARAAAKAFNQTLEPLDNKISKYLNGNPIRVDGRPRASGVMDTIRAAVAHGLKVPPEFEDASIVDLIEKAVVTEWFAGCKPFKDAIGTFTKIVFVTLIASSDKTEEVRRLAMGRLLGDLSRKMQYKAEQGGNDPLKLLIHSTHDTAIAGLCSTLDVYDEKWPAFTASITFELFRKVPIEPESPTSSSQKLLSRFSSKPVAEHYVRMRYQNNNLFLPICAETGKHLPGSPEFCTLAAFRERLKELTPKDWKEECLHAPAGIP